MNNNHLKEGSQYSKTLRQNYLFLTVFKITRHRVMSLGCVFLLFYIFKIGGLVLSYRLQRTQIGYIRGRIYSAIR